MQYLNDLNGLNTLNTSNSYILMKVPETKSPQINSSFLPNIINSNETLVKPSYVLIQNPESTATSQSSDLLYKNLIQDIIFQIFNNYSDIPNKLLLNKEFINNITIQISQKIYNNFTKKLLEDTAFFKILTEQMSQELFKTIPHKLLQDNDFSKDFTEQIYEDIKTKLQTESQTPDLTQTAPSDLIQTASQTPDLTQTAPQTPDLTQTVSQQNNNKFKKPLPTNLEEIPSIDYLDYFYYLNKNYFDNFKSNDEYLNFKNNKFIYSNSNISTIFNEENFIKFIESYKNKDIILAEKILKYFSKLQIFTNNDVIDNIKKIAKELANKYYTNETNLFIFVLFPSLKKISDIIDGSNFWALLVLYKYLKEEPNYDKERTFIVNDVKNLNKELKMKYPENKLSGYSIKYIFIDDAAFHGVQLSDMIKNFINTNNINIESILPIIPFIHNKSKFKYKEQSIIGTEMVNPFYQVENDFNNTFNEIDLIVKLDNNKITTLTSLLGINEYNLPVIFEYNLGSSYSTYTCLFEYGPIFNNIIEIYNEKIEIKNNNSTWDDYCKEVIRKIDLTKFKSINSTVSSSEGNSSTKNVIENIKIFNLPGEIDPNINTRKYSFCEKSSIIKKAYGKEFYSKDSITFINIFDNINFIYDKNKNEVDKINNILVSIM
jgi:hypothetical protein